MDEIGSPLAGISGKAMNGVLHGFLLASSFSMFLKMDGKLLFPASAQPATWSTMGRASFAEGVLGAKLVGAFIITSNFYFNVACGVFACDLTGAKFTINF